jgi:uncharacterized membrane protein YbhN (UPF0104 family)
MNAPLPENASSKAPRRRLGQLIRVCIAGLVTAAFAWTVWKATRELASTPFDWRQFGWQTIPLAGLFYALALGCASRMWHRVLLSMGVAIPYLQAARAFAASQLAKYVPGKAMVLVVRCGLVCGPEDRPGKSSDTPAPARLGPVIASTFVETLMWVLVGAQVGCIGLLFRPGISTELFWGAIGIMLLFGVLTLPPVFSQAIHLAAKMKRAKNWDETKFQLDWQTYFRAWSWSLLGWLLYGGAMFFVLRAVSGMPLDGSAYGLALTTICLATVGGFISMLPGGLGVRELVMLPLLAGSFSTPVALISAILMRLVCVAVELLLAAISHFFARR